MTQRVERIRVTSNKLKIIFLKTAEEHKTQARRLALGLSEAEGFTHF